MYEYITQYVPYKSDEDLMRQLNEAASLGWEVLTVYPQTWSKGFFLRNDSVCTAAMVVYRRVSSHNVTAQS